jgi:calcineurin-like phosphoesterase
MPVPFEVASGEVKMDSIVITIDSNTKTAEKIERLSIRQDYKETTVYDTDDGKPEYFNDF